MPVSISLPSRPRCLPRNVAGRLFAWRCAIPQFKDNPLAGAGLLSGAKGQAEWLKLTVLRQWRLRLLPQGGPIRWGVMRLKPNGGNAPQRLKQKREKAEDRAGRNQADKRRADETGAGMTGELRGTQFRIHKCQHRYLGVIKTASARKAARGQVPRQQRHAHSRRETPCIRQGQPAVQHR